MNWHLQSIEKSLKALQTGPDIGLTQSEADARLKQYGRNELVEKGGRTPLKIFWEQLTATMVLILIAAAVVAGLLGDLKNTIAISAIVVLYAILGFVQEYRAEQAIAALKKFVRAERACPARRQTLREISAHVTLCPATSSNSKRQMSCLPMCACSKRSTCASRKPR
jgi:P-type Ca2+ transporter type 2C